jgi:uncharacterized repeat protein (TIGR01451 family)
VRSAGAREVARTRSAQIVTAPNSASYVPDCNDPDAQDPACIDLTPEIIDAEHAAGYPYYIGHAEPTTLFFSTKGASGNNMRWKFKLPATDPAPTQNGSSVANFELYSALWMGLALCDPNSKPYGACNAISDANNPSTAGAAFLELQFYPPGSKFGGCSDTQWCVNLHINTLQDRNLNQIMNCNEPTTSAYVTTNGSPGGTKLLMNNGDTIIVTIHDNPNGLEADVNDTTIAASGFMVASGANGFVHNANQTDCTTAAFDFHAMYATASPGQVVPWAGLKPNVAFNFEIGHFELCQDSNCGTKPDSDTDDTNCVTVRGIGGCLASDTDHDGTSYVADWPDGTASHPASLILTNPTDSGVGPFSGATVASATYDEPYGTIRFRTTETTAGAFYPYWSQGRDLNVCVFHFGNDLPGTTNDFGKAAQYGTGTTMPNPCAGSPPSIAKAFGAPTIPLGQATTLTLTITNPNATLDLTGISFTDALPAGLQLTSSISGPACGPFVSSGSATNIVLSNIQIPGGGTCVFTATVAGLTPGVKNNTTSTITANESDSSGAAASASITVVAPPSITKNFGAVSIPLGGGVTTLNLTITNPNTTVSLMGVGVSDSLPGGLVVASPNGLTNSCGGTATATAGSSSITLVGGVIAPSGSCTLSVNVTGTTPGAKNNTTSNVTSTNGGPGNTASASLAVLAPPTITKSFADAEVQLFSGSTAVSFTLSNPPANTLALTGVGFTDTLPAGLLVQVPDNGLVGTCGGGTITAVPGSNSISLSGATLPVNGSCTFSVVVQGANIGVWVNTTSPVTSTNGGTGLAASDTTSVDDLFFIYFFS